MITISLNVLNPADLEAYLDILERRNLLNATSISTKAAPIIKGAPRGNAGSYFRELAVKCDAYLAEHGFTSRPRATPEELVMRAKIDKSRERAALTGINWKVDVISRHTVMLENGYDIFASSDVIAADAEEVQVDYDIDLDNVPV